MIYSLSQEARRAKYDPYKQVLNNKRKDNIGSGILQISTPWHFWVEHLFPVRTLDQTETKCPKLTKQTGPKAFVSQSTPHPPNSACPTSS